MSTINIRDLSWGQRFAVINAYVLSDEQACTTLGVTQQELTTARGLVSKGVFKVDHTINVDVYGVLFNGATDPSQLGAPGSFTPVAKRKGRKGDKIAAAFAAIPSDPISVDEFLADHDISLPVLRQFKRFDTTGLPGRVFVRKVGGRSDGVLMVWRGVEESTEPTLDINPVEQDNAVTDPQELPA